LPERPIFRLGELLLQAGAINRAQLNAALEVQRQTKGRLGSILVELGHVDERTIGMVLADQLKIASATAAQLEGVPKNALTLVAKEFAARYRAVPLRVDGKRLWTAMGDPLDREAITALEKHTGLELRPMVAPDVLLEFALDKHYGIKRQPRIVEVRDAELLEVGAPLAVYEPHLNPPGSAIGYLDDQRPATRPPSPSPPPLPRVAPQIAAPPPVAAPAPVAAPGPVAAPAPTKASPCTLDADALRGALLIAASDDDIFDRLLDALAPVAPRLAVLLVRSGVLVAHRGRGVDAQGLQSVRLPLTESPQLVKMLEAGAPYLGPLPSQLGSLFQEVGDASGLLLPLTLGKRPVGVLIGGNVSPSLQRTPTTLERIGAMVDLALHASHLRARLARS